MKLASLCLLLGTALCLLGCVQVVEDPSMARSQLAVSSVWDMPGKYEEGSRFALSPKYLKAVSIKAEQVKNVYAIYADKITQSLQSKGYVLSKPNEIPDFYVGFGIALAEDLSDTTIGEKFGVTPGLQSKGDLDKGSFLIYVEDAIMHQRVWRGAVQGFVQLELNKEERKERSMYIVNLVLAQFYKQ